MDGKEKIDGWLVGWMDIKNRWMVRCIENNGW